MVHSALPQRERENTMWSEKVVPVLWLWACFLIIGICLGVWWGK